MISYHTVYKNCSRDGIESNVSLVTVMLDSVFSSFALTLSKPLLCYALHFVRPESFLPSDSLESNCEQLEFSFY